MNIHFSSKSCEWETPQDLFDKYNAIYNFETDLAATSENKKCDKYYTKEDNSLIYPWRGICWLNPPYGREIGVWMAKAYSSGRMGATIICLIPARTDTSWWHEYVMKGEIEFIRGRLKFNGHKNSAPFPSAIVIFGEIK